MKGSDPRSKGFLRHEALLPFREPSCNPLKSEPRSDFNSRQSKVTQTTPIVSTISQLVAFLLHPHHLRCSTTSQRVAPTTLH